MFNFLKIFQTKKINSPIYLYNTLTKKKDVFKPIKDGNVGIYTCGPTVYLFPHIGNMRTYIFEDILKRVLSYNNYDVNHVMNITDVGHLTNDRDMGEDKVEKEAQKEGKTAWEIASFYTEAFKKDLNYLNIIYPNIFCKATDNIPEQISLIQTLEKKGYTYKIDDGIYFDTSKVTDYAKLSGQNLEDLKEGARVEINAGKKNHTDFALWKFSPLDSKREMEWKSPYGVGFPGWHLECSAMSMKYLGDQFDIHCGGIDHVNIHHTNEIAQTESATGKKPWVNYWIHGAFLNIKVQDGDLPAQSGKMAKSGGNYLTLQNTFVDKKINPLVYRFATLTTHYRKSMEWNDEIMLAAENGFKNLYSKISNLGTNIGKRNSEWENKFLLAINDDLNMPQAMAILNEMLKSDLLPADKLVSALDFDEVFGLKLSEATKKSYILEAETGEFKSSRGDANIIIYRGGKPSNELVEILKERNIAKKNKNWQKSDELRDKIISMGYSIKDTISGAEVEKI